MIMRRPVLGLSWLLLVGALFGLARPARADVLDPFYEWGAVQYFQFNIENVAYDTNSRQVTVTFSITNPQDGNSAYDIFTDDHFVPDLMTELVVDIGWNAKEFTNAGSGDPEGAAYPVAINVLTSAVALPNNRLQVSAVLPPAAYGTGEVIFEGHPRWYRDSAATYVRVPVKTVYQLFKISDAQIVPRREVVDWNKCLNCHNGTSKDGWGLPIYRLAEHGGNRNEELHACQVCHNANQTDIPFRITGTEVPVDLKYLTHAIHGAIMRENPLTVISFGGIPVPFSLVSFPGGKDNLKQCTNCHIDTNGTGTFELPLKPEVLGTTVNTGSTPGGFLDTDPTNDLNMTPTMAVCSACHDSGDAISHMTASTSGGSNHALQSQIDSGAVKEKCADCHGKGKTKDVRAIHVTGDGGGGDCSVSRGGAGARGGLANLAAIGLALAWVRRRTLAAGARRSVVG